MLRVLVDATAIPGDRGGVGRYLDGLLAALGQRADVSLVILCQQSDAEHFSGSAFSGPNVEVHPVTARLRSRPLRLVWEQVGLPRLARRLRADVVHCPHYTMPMLGRIPVVVTLHDATFFSDPGVHTPGKARFFRLATRFAVRRAAALVVPSAATRDELCRLVSPAAGRAVVAHHGVDPAVFAPPTPEAIAELRRHLDLGAQSFIAFLGTLEPRKNVPALIRAWQQAMTDRVNPPALVLAGGPGWDDQVDAAAATVPATLRLLRPGYLPLPLIPALLGGAELVVYPALGEGFGLPVLEAMACGAATVTTRRLALPEVGGDAVEYCPVDAGGMATVLAGLLGNADRRAELRVRGQARAKEFSWAAAAGEHLRAYQAASTGAAR